MNKETLYKLPFVKHNNPSGWIEPTTFCQLKCPHCYRGTDRDDFKPEHRKIEEIYKEIDELISIRNIQTLSVVGGEPMLYPNLDKLITYAVKRNLEVVINTNGILINKESLKVLKSLGVHKVVIHIDKYQNRENIINEVEANKLREEYCNLFRETGGISLGFNMPISGDNFQDLDIVIPFLKNNADIINLCLFTILRPMLPNENFSDNFLVEDEKVFARIKELYGLEYCAYLGRTIMDEISWLYSFNVFADKNFLGSADKNLAKFFQEENLRKNQRYVYQAEGKMSLRFFLYLFLNKSARKIIKNYLFKFKMKGRLNEQSLIILSPPKLVNGRFDLCEACLCGMLYKGRMVPSCLLERVKQGENIFCE